MTTGYYRTYSPVVAGTLNFTILLGANAAQSFTADSFDPLANGTHLEFSFVANSNIMMNYIMVCESTMVTLMPRNNRLPRP